jgi:hypothetical protein
MKYVDAVSLSNEFNQNLQIINEYLDTSKDNIIKFFRRSFENMNEINNNNNNNNISDIVILDDFIHLIQKNNETVTKVHIWKNIKSIYSLASSSRYFLQLLHKKYGMAIFIILNYYEYYQYISIKKKISVDFNNLMIIPNNFINSINVLI